MIRYVSYSEGYSSSDIHLIIQNYVCLYIILKKNILICLKVPSNVTYYCHTDLCQLVYILRIHLFITIIVL